MKKPERENDFILELEQNALDSLTHGIEHFMERKRPTDIKYSVLHVFHAVELFLKARLAKAHPLLLYQKPEVPLNKSPTVDFSSLLGRLHNVGCSFSKQSLDDLTYLRQVRNSIEHHHVEEHRDTLEEYVARTLRLLDGFLEKELGILLKERLEKKAYHMMSELLYSYEERLEKAQREMKLYLPSDAEIYNSKGLVEAITLICEECGEETIVIPDPTSNDGTVHCFFCGADFYMTVCERCNEPMLSMKPFDEEHSLICVNCWDSITAAD